MQALLNPAGLRRTNHRRIPASRVGSRKFRHLLRAACNEVGLSIEGRTIVGLQLTQARGMLFAPDQGHGQDCHALSYVNGFEPLTRIGVEKLATLWVSTVARRNWVSFAQHLRCLALV